MEDPSSLNVAECGVLNHKREQAHKKTSTVGLKNAYWKWVDSIIGFFLNTYMVVLEPCSAKVNTLLQLCDPFLESFEKPL